MTQTQLKQFILELVSKAYNLHHEALKLGLKPKEPRMSVTAIREELINHGHSIHWESTKHQFSLIRSALNSLTNEGKLSKSHGWSSHTNQEIAMWEPSQLRGEQ